MTEITFWFCVALVLYSYLGYPCALLALGLFRGRPVIRRAMTPRVSFVITAYNEQARIAQKLENTLRQDYPAGAFEIIVASDCSTDATDDIVRAHGHRVRLVRATERRGKEAAQELALREASGDILVFSDVATALAPDGVSTIVSNFADPTVGCVSSEDRFVDADGRVSGEGAYVRYEMFLRALESRVNSVVGLSGSFFAARRDVCRRWAVDRQSDFSTLLNAVQMGLRGVSDPASAGYYRNITDERREFDRKVRTVARGIAVFAANLGMLNVFRYGLFSWQLASHKLTRWLAPFALIVAAASSAWLASESPLYGAAALAQGGFYAAAVAGRRTGSRLLRIPAFFVVSNLAVLIAWLRFVRGDRITTWTPSERVSTLPQVTTGSREST
jgi:glycosyltransferase involved in cell wall biosynthesis